MIPPISRPQQAYQDPQTDKVHLLETKEDLLHKIKMDIFHKFFMEKDDDDPQKMPEKMDM